jgi:hypothetical protein
VFPASINAFSLCPTNALTLALPDDGTLKLSYPSHTLKGQTESVSEIAVLRSYVVVMQRTVRYMLRFADANYDFSDTLRNNHHCVRKP